MAKSKSPRTPNQTWMSVTEAKFTLSKGMTPEGKISIAAHAICDCGNCQTISIDKKLPHHVIAQKFQKLGWKMSRKTAACPECQKPKQEKPAMVKPTLVSDQTPVEPSPQLLRDAMLALSEAFDEHTGSYTENYSDARIAKELGMAANAIIMIREKYFGPLKEIPELTVLRDDISSLGELLAEQVKGFDDSIKDLRRRLNELEHKFK